MSSLWNGILDLLGTLLAACYSLVDSYIFAITLFTLIIMIVFTPLTIKSTRSMMAMQQIQPEMKALQAKYRDDRQTLNTEMMALYQRHGVNPLGGCLPMLVQIPIFFALFSLLRGLTRLNGDGSEFNPRHLDEESELFKDLSSAGAEMLSFGIDLSSQANEVVSDSLVSSLPYVAMVVITGLTSWYQQRQMAARRTPGVEIPQQQQMLMRILPWTLPIFAFFMPAALVVYFIVSNMWRVGQQAYISRKIHKPAAALAAEAAIETEVVDPPTPKKKSGQNQTKGGQKASGNGGKNKASQNKAADDKASGNKAAGNKAGQKKRASRSSSGSAQASDRPRPRPRQRTRPAQPPTASTSKSGRGGRSKAAPAEPSKPAPTSRTAGHGPAKRPANKRKKR